ncbi:unnamed protein product, partial [Mesorhabditis spiculigera]
MRRGDHIISTVTLLLLCCFAGFSHADDSILRIEERLTTDREFYENWMHLVGLQAQELEEQTADFPIDANEIYRNLTKCRRVAAQYADHVDYVRPEDIAIYAEIGHLSRYCAHNFSMLQAGILDSCQHRPSENELPSIERLLRLFADNLTVVSTNNRDDPLRDQAKKIGEAVRRLDRHAEKWKLIVVIPSVQDGEASETGQTAVEVLAMIEELQKQLPVRTLVVVVENSGKGIWADASHSHAACRQMLSKWKIHSQYNTENIWDQVNRIADLNFRKANFTVEILPLLRNASLTHLPDAMDLSVLGYDCAHFSERGLSLLHTGIWNELWTTAKLRNRHWRPTPNMVICPNPRCPFIRTQVNSEKCIWNEVESWTSPLPPEIIALCILALAVLLSICLLCCLCMHKAPKLKKKRMHSFGSTFSSIRFIDEDS